MKASKSKESSAEKSMSIFAGAGERPLAGRSGLGCVGQCDPTSDEAENASEKLVANEIC